MQSEKKSVHATHNNRRCMCSLLDRIGGIVRFHPADGSRRKRCHSLSHLLRLQHPHHSVNISAIVCIKPSSATEDVPFWSKMLRHHISRKKPSTTAAPDQSSASTLESRLCSMALAPGKIQLEILQYVKSVFLSTIGILSLHCGRFLEKV